MIDEALDPTTHDLVYTGYDGATVSERAQLAQHVKIRLLWIRGEWFLNTELGLPYFKEILVKNPDLSAIDIMLKATILETPGILSLISYSSEIIKTIRKLNVSFVAESEFGTFSLEI